MNAHNEQSFLEAIVSVGASIVAAGVAVWKFSQKNPKLAGAIAVFCLGGGWSWGTQTDPRQILVWANAPLMEPMQADIRMVKQVVIRLPGADSVLAQLQIEKDSVARYRRDSAERARWTR